MNTGDPRELWKRDDPDLPVALTASKMCALARRSEQALIWSRRVGVVVLAGLGLAFAHNTWAVDQPWVRLGQAWMLVVMASYVWLLLRDRTGSRASSEPCAQFLLRLLERRRSGFVGAGRLALLAIPAILANWWGGGLAIRAQAMGLEPSSPQYRFMTSAWPAILLFVAILLAWNALRVAGNKAAAEVEALRRDVAA